MAEKQLAETPRRPRAAKGYPGLKELLRAAVLYTLESHILREAMRLTPSSSSPEAERLKLGERPRRGELARLVREAMTLEERAVEYLEQAHRVLTQKNG